jgi:hypothetical protein
MEHDLQYVPPMIHTAISSRATRYRKVVAASLVILGVSLLCAPRSFAQSITAGEVTGTVTDPSGAAVPNASVTLTNVNTNAAQMATTNAEGSYKFAFTVPGIYRVAVTASGFQGAERSGVNVVAGSPTPLDIRLTLGGGPNTTVEVVEAAAVLQTENADDTTSFSAEAIQDLPNPGGDLTSIAQTVAGVVMNTQSGYGNFSANGMPGTSNLFTINGQNYNDPFLNLNNSGASNLTLGANDIAEANVINNAYSAQYGQYAGTQVSYITKSGQNQFHGSEVYMWNGRAMNANQFFANEVGSPTPFNNFNQWGVNVNGPIRKNKTFFDFDYEGVRNVLPTAANQSLMPSPQFQSATLANLAADGNAAEIPFYKQVFAIYNGSPGAAGATPAPGATATAGAGCNGTLFPGLSATDPCALQFRVTPPNLNRENQYQGRVDHSFSEKDRVYFRFWRDNGFQPTYTSPFSTTFNEQSLQPQFSAQANEIHTFGPNTVNQFNGSALFYAAFFGPANAGAQLSALPTALNFGDGSFTNIGTEWEGNFFPFPQGRRVFQYQAIDDFSHIHGRHTIRAGISWLHDNLTDLTFEENRYGLVSTNQTDFFNGGGGSTALNQYFPSSSEQGYVFQTLGGYVADDWKVSDSLTISLNLRLEHYANPTCDSSCFSRLANGFNGTSISGATPYDQLILSGQKNAYASTQPLVWEPRIGIAWKPFKSDKTVIRTGAGIFADEIEGQLAGQAALNTPGLTAFTIGNGNIAPGVPGSLFTTAAAADAALLAGFHNGGSFNSLSASVPGFAAPNFTSFPNHLDAPTYYKWNFEVQQSIGSRTVLSVNYSGMHGIHIPVPDGGMNGYCPASVCTNGFVGLPTAVPAPSFGTVIQYLQAGTSNYNGLQVSLQRRLAAGLSFNVNYVWSHALDDVSNGGSNEPFGAIVTDPSISFPQNPFNIRANYGSADYDVRHYFSANMVYNDVIRHAGFKKGPNMIFGGWTFSSTWFLRSGMPFSIVDGSATYGALYGQNYDGVILASAATSISGGGNCHYAVNTPCLNISQFAPSESVTGVPNGFGTVGRNSYRGPGFFNADFALMKDIRIRERFTFSFGAQAYNVFNHVNFDNPVNDISNPNFGSSIAVVGPPTSLLGSFVGAGSSPRFVEIKGQFRF